MLEPASLPGRTLRCSGWSEDHSYSIALESQRYALTNQVE